MRNLGKAKDISKSWEGFPSEGKAVQFLCLVVFIGQWQKQDNAEVISVEIG